MSLELGPETVRVMATLLARYGERGIPAWFLERWKVVPDEIRVMAKRLERSRPWER